MATKTKPAKKKATPTKAKAEAPKAEAPAKAEAKPELKVSKEAKAVVDELAAGTRSQASAVDELSEMGYKVGEIAKLLDRPYRQVFNVKNRKKYGARPSEREATPSTKAKATE